MSNIASSPRERRLKTEVSRGEEASEIENPGRPILYFLSHECRRRLHDTTPHRSLASEMLTTWLSDSACGTLRQRQKERQKKFLDAPHSRPDVSGLKLSVFRFFLDGENVSNMERKGGGSFHSLVELNMEEGSSISVARKSGRGRSSQHQHLHGSLLKSWGQNGPIDHKL